MTHVRILQDARRKLLLLAAATITAATVVFSASPAFADHCSYMEDGPGNSGYAQLHVKANNGPGDHNEGMHKGYATCNPNSANYSP